MTGDHFFLQSAAEDVVAAIAGELGATRPAPVGWR
jgi:surfactin synthase thioesterase subunit